LSPPPCFAGHRRRREASASVRRRRQAASGGRFGRAGFAAAFVNIFVVEFVIWVCMLAWYTVPVVVPPVLIVDALIVYTLTRAQGTAAQIGRGMLIGCAGPLLTLLLFIPAYLIAHLFGPV
jgi:hypothetical protein